jgi:hypothetical protein
MNTIPTTQDWASDPDGALAASLEIAKTTAAHGDASTQAVAFGIAARVLVAAAPIIGQALGGPLGALAGAAVSQVATSLQQQQTNALTALTPGQLALVDAAIAAGAQAVVKPAP